MDVIRCGCKAQGKACSNDICSCHHAKISCTIYCACISADNCLNPYKRREEDEDEYILAQMNAEENEELLSFDADDEN